MLKNYAIGATLLALMFSTGTSAQSPKPQPTRAEVKAQWQPTPTPAHAFNDYRGGGGDNCASANPLIVGTSCVPATFDASGATQSLAPIACGGFTSPAANDLWFSFQANTANTTITVTGLGDFDAVVQYFSGSCGSLTSLGCIDATFPPASTVETATIGTTVGTTYYIRVYYYSSPMPTNFQFTICLVGSGGGGSTPPNDLCTGASVQNLNAGSTVTFNGNNTGATLLAGTTFVVVWEAFTTTQCTDVTLNYCVPGSVFENFLINLTSACPDVLTGLVAGGNTACEVTFAQLPAGTWYIPVLVDPATTPVGAYTITASAVACPPGYCAAGATSLEFEKIANVTFSNINNNSTATAGYEDFTAIVGNVVAGQSYAFSLTIDDPYEDDQVLVWIDLDQNESFEPGELVFSTTPPQADGNVSGTIIIPASATNGQTRMRIRLHDSALGGNPAPCGTSTYGQVEDYTLNISGGGAICNADAGTLSGGGVVCLENDEATLTATADGNANVPVGYSTLYVLTEGAGLVIVQASPTPEFVVDAEGDYTIHTLVYDPTTLDLGIVEFGVTTGFDVNGLLIQGGGEICASLDVAGAAFSVVVCGSYCDAGASGVGLGLDERIVNVTFAGINNNSPNVTPVAPAYSDFTAIVGNVVIGQSYPIAVDVNRTGANTSWSENQVLVWIDLNQDGDFEDAGELVFTSAVGSVDIYTGTITIPAGSSVGATRMRVRLHDVHDGTDYINNFNNTPCGLASYGEVEDYTVVIDFTSGVEEQVNNGFSIFPNPGDGNLNVLYGGVSGRASMEVYDMTGRVLHSDVRQLNNGERSTLSLSGRLAAGTYILRLTNEHGSMEQRFVVQ